MTFCYYRFRNAEKEHHGVSATAREIHEQPALDAQAYYEVVYETPFVRW